MPKQANHTFQGLRLTASTKRTGRSKHKTQMLKCQYGAACTRKDCVYRHPPKPKGGTKKEGCPPAHVPTTGAICSHFLQGNCMWGNRCRNIHTQRDAPLPPVEADGGRRRLGGDGSEGFVQPVYAPAGFGGIGAGFVPMSWEQQYRPELSSSSVSTSASGAGVPLVGETGQPWPALGGGGVGGGGVGGGGVGGRAAGFDPTMGVGIPPGGRARGAAGRGRGIGSGSTPDARAALERAKAAEAAARQEAEATAAARRPVLAAIMRDYTVSEQDRQRLLRQTQDGSLPPEVWAHYERMAATAATAPAPAPGPAPGPAAGSVPTGSEFRDLTGVREAAPAPDVPSGASHAPAAAAAAWSARPPPPPADEELDAEASTFMSKEQRSTLDLACREILASPGILAEMGFSRALGVFLGQILAATGLEKTLLRYAAHRTLLAILSGPDPVGSAEGGLSPERREALIRAMLEQAPPAPDMALLRYQRAQGAQSAAASVATETASFGLAAKLKAKQASTSKLAASAAAWTPKPRAPSSRPVPAAAAPKPAAAAPKPAAPKPAARAPPRADPPRLRGEGAWTTVKAKPKGGGRGRGQVGAARGHAPPVVGEERGGVWVESGQRAAADYGAGGLRAAAVAAHGRMETFFAVAAEAHRHGDGARAAEMARRGRAAKAEMEAAHARASAAILARRTAQLPESARASTLDLHGQHLREGLTLLEARVAAARAEGRRSLTVITGAGLHTEVYGGRRRTATLRERVASWLRDSGLRFREAGGSGAGAGAGGTFTVSL